MSDEQLWAHLNTLAVQRGGSLRVTRGNGSSVAEIITATDVGMSVDFGVDGATQRQAMERLAHLVRDSS